MGYAESRHASYWLSFFAFIEASFFPLPPSTLMTAIITSGQRHRWIFYATITTIFSVLGGLFGYLIGFVFFDTVGQIIIKTYDLSDEIIKVGSQFDANAFISILVAAFTPIPYKVFTLAAGFFKIDLFTFITASVIGRGLRFYIVAWFLNFVEERTGDKYIKHINTLAIAVALLVIIYFIWKIFTALL